MYMRISHRLSRANTDNRHIISDEIARVLQTPQDIMESTMGVQSPSTLPTDVCVCAHKGPPCVQSNSYSLIALIPL